MGVRAGDRVASRVCRGHIKGVDFRDKSGMAALFGTAAAVAVALAFPPFSPQIGTGRLAVDEPLANRVRSGRKQP